MAKYKKSSSAMDPVMGFIFDKCEVNKDTLRYLLSLLPEQIASRMVLGIAGIYNPLTMLETMPQVSKVYNDASAEKYSTCKFDSFDYFENSVHYSYHRKSYRIFKTEADAEKYAKTGNYNWSDRSSISESTPNEEYPFVGMHESDCTGSTNYEDWIANAVETDNLGEI